MLKKYLIGGVVSMGIVISLFCLSIRGCLSQYDERYALPGVLYFNNNGTPVFFSLLQLNETTSYSSEQGVETKTFDNYYFVQTNSAITGEVVLKRKLKKRSGNKSVDAVIIGATEKNAWIFLDGLFELDPNTLRTLTDSKMIEDRNPWLRKMLPSKEKYYKFDKETNSIKITAIDGSMWVLNTTTLSVTRNEKIYFNDISLDETELQSRLKELQKSNIDVYSMSVNQDTLNGKWITLYSEDELRKLHKMSFTGTYSQDLRRQIFTADYSKFIETGSYINLANFRKTAATEYFLDGGFLIDRKTAQIIRPDDTQGYLIVCKSQIGAAGRIMLYRLTHDGTVVWKLNTGLNTWVDWNYSNHRIIIFGNSHNEAMNPGYDLMLNIEVNSGQMNRYDYFLDKNEFHGQFE